MDKIIEELQRFHFTKIEAQIYCILLRNKELNGSKVAKLMNVPRTSAYMALDSLYKKGAVFLIPGEHRLYRAQNPKILLDNMKERFGKSFEILDNELSRFEIFSADDQYWNIKGFNNFLLKVREMLQSAKQEIYINTNMDLRVFSLELSEASERGVRVIVFSFEDLNMEGLSIEFYHNPKKAMESVTKRIMLSIDNKMVLILSQNPSGEALGTFTENPLLVSIVSEHIHHDIYLLKLEERSQADLIDAQIRIGSRFEKGWDLD